MIEKELKNYFLTIPSIKFAVGGVYAGRIPTDEASSEVIVIKQITGERTYTLDGEDPFVTKVIQIDILSRNDASSATLHAIFENLRKALNVFAKAPGKMGSMFVGSIQIISEGVTLTSSAVGTTWKRQRSFDIQLIHDQKTEFV